MATIRGVVDENGNIVQGAGYTVTYNPNGTGTYTVNFSTTFLRFPVVVVSPYVGNSTTNRFATIYNISTRSFSISIWKAQKDAAKRNTGFTFSATDVFGIGGDG